MEDKNKDRTGLRCCLLGYLKWECDKTGTTMKFCKDGKEFHMNDKIAIDATRRKEDTNAK